MELADIQASVEAFSQRICSGLGKANFEKRRKLVELMIDRVVVRDGEMEIRYVIPLSPESEQIRFCHLRKDYHHPAVRFEIDPSHLGTGKVYARINGTPGMVAGILSLCPLP
jgi:hypothetical protein